MKFHLSFNKVSSNFSKPPTDKNSTTEQTISPIKSPNKEDADMKMIESLQSQLIEQQKKYEAQLKAQKTEFESKLAANTTKYESEIAIKTNELAKMKQKLDDMINRHDEENREENEAVFNKSIELLDADSMNELETICQIGSGGGGRVMKVAKKMMYALKIMNVGKDSQKNFISFHQFMNEYEIMNMLNHPNILKTYGFFTSDETNPPSILLEFCPSNLDDEMSKSSLSNVKMVCIIYQIVEGMKYIHFRKIVHRDLKTSNILISEDGTVKICDFGIAKLMSTEQQLTTGGVGTQKFMAPEIINEEDYNEKADVYSFGVLIFALLNKGNMPDIKLRDICLGIQAEIPSSFTDFAQCLIKSCWSFDPNERPSFDKILNDLSRNNYNLVNLNKSERKQVVEFVKNHKSKIPHY